MVTQRRTMAVKKREATSSGTARELRCRAEADRAAELERRAERRALEQQAALDDAEAKRALEAAKAEAAVERRREIEASRLACQEEDARKEKARGARIPDRSPRYDTNFPVLCIQDFLY